MAVAQLQYNPMSGQWEDQRSDETLQYNPYTSKWEYVNTNDVLKYNPYTGQYYYGEQEQQKVQLNVPQYLN